ncbi:hypothetical protein DRW07_13600 [Alteromonas sediminis]|uniref:Uncharacterized protein n=1 Tax=Alteromonas sediminis TaxID=2259342 RepID=A0A3N5YLA2_9ALTE|nr:hypothetical protein [Alteromonas sediminis]RPJ65841.1 hypothetical protein DRW07_13600 [Alteromonas sediminis]
MLKHSLAKMIIIPGLVLTTLFTSWTTLASNTENATTAFYRHIMFRETPYATYRGIHPVVEETAPYFAHYQFTHDDKGRVTSIRYQMQENLIFGNQVWDSFIWFAPQVNIDYGPGKEVHTYFDVNGRQIAAHGDVYSAHYSLDKSGKRQSLHFYDENGEPSQNEWNIHRYEWRHEGGYVFEKRFNLANEQQPLRPEFEFYEVKLDYDKNGQLAFVYNLGLDGTPTNNSSGAGIDRITYDQNGNFVRWQVYDKEGKPVEGNRPMVHLGEHLYDEFGNKVGLRGYDRFGKQIPFSWGAFEHSATFNERGNQIRQRIVDESGSTLQFFARKYTPDHSKILYVQSLNDNEMVTHSPALGGAAQVRYQYISDGSYKIERLNADGSVFTDNNQSASSQ